MAERGAFRADSAVRIVAICLAWLSVPVAFGEENARRLSETPGVPKVRGGRTFRPPVIRLPPTGTTPRPSGKMVFPPAGRYLGEVFDPTSVETGVEPGPQLRQWFQRAESNVRADYRGYYSWHTLRDLALGVAVAAPLANTSVDHDIRDWWQDDVRNAGTDRAAAFWKVFGEGAIFIPTLACLAIVGKTMDDRPAFDLAGEFGGHATRAFLVGAPPMLAMQVFLGASRPGETEYDSRWKPLDDANAVSGHAFIGAVPFITAAHLTESRTASAFLYLGSAGTAWSRVNDDAHYLSQAILGWYMAYLACRSVHATERESEQAVRLVPLPGPELTGLKLVWRR